jgi:serpin B
MDGYFRFARVLTLSLAILQCSHREAIPRDEEGQAPSGRVSRFSEPVNMFGLNLFREVAKGEVDKNVFICPYSVSEALMMTHGGARGSTEEAMRATLGLGSLTREQICGLSRNLRESLMGKDPKVIMEVANSIWYREDRAFEEEFLSRSTTCFDALVRALDFTDPNAHDFINRWVSERTHGKIRKILGPIKSDMAMFLVNAIYFKGTWKYTFDEKATYDGKFLGPGGAEIPCRMMVQGDRFPYLENELFQAVDLSYGEGNFSMTVFLPKGDLSADSLITHLTSENWTKWRGDLVPSKGTVEIPKFTLEYEIVMNEVLHSLGMAVAFDKSMADFTGMDRRGGLCIDEVKHKTFVEVNEEGTEAAAATSVGIMITSIQGREFHMKADRPFVFTIQEKESGVLLFAGKITHPEVP